LAAEVEGREPPPVKLVTAEATGPPLMTNELVNVTMARPIAIDFPASPA